MNKKNLTALVLALSLGLFSCDKQSPEVKTPEKPSTEQEGKKQEGKVDEGEKETKENLPPVVEDTFAPASVQLGLYGGHLHEPKSDPAFHYVPSVKGLNVLAFEQPIKMSRDAQGKWRPLDGQRDKWRVVKYGLDDKGLASRVYGLWIDYLDKDGKNINAQIATGANDGLYQHFFRVTDVKKWGSKGVDDASDKDPKTLVEYFYKDTTPHDQPHHTGRKEEPGAPFTYDTNPRGLKGYLQFPKSFKSFTLHIELRKFASADEKNKTVKAWHDTQAGTVVSRISIPVIIFAEYPDDYIEDDVTGFEADELDEFLKDFKLEKIKSANDRRIIKDFMDAFGVDAVSLIKEFNHRLTTGERSNEAGGVWF
ncbi:MAG: hypothetical protein Q4A64_01495 [Porphyromonadaceae bacterium]|nr:hypothetical protein [Porphyromonadaceae bacterium]